MLLQWQLSPEDGVFASASYDGTVVLWEPIQRADRNIVVKIVPPADAPTVGKQQTIQHQI